MSYHDSDTCLQHDGLPTWACPDCEHPASQETDPGLPWREYLLPTPIEVVSGVRAEGDPDGC